MRVQLLADHHFTQVGGTTIKLNAGSILGTGAGDYPIGQIANFAVTAAMLSLDGAATTAISAEQTRNSAVVIPPGQGKSSGIPVPQPHKGATVTANSTKSWNN
jgi:hypothetical protein